MISPPIRSDDRFDEAITRKSKSSSSVSDSQAMTRHLEGILERIRQTAQERRVAEQRAQPEIPDAEIPTKKTAVEKPVVEETVVKEPVLSATPVHEDEGKGIAVHDLQADDQVSHDEHETEKGHGQEEENAAVVIYQKEGN